MSKTNNLTDFLTDTANAIRAKKGTTAKINPQNFSSEIASIQTGITGFFTSGAVPSGDLVIESDYDNVVTTFVDVTYIANFSYKTASLHSPGTTLKIPYDLAVPNGPCQVISISGSPEIVSNTGTYYIIIGGIWVLVDEDYEFQVIRKGDYIWIFYR